MSRFERILLVTDATHQATAAEETALAIAHAHGSEVICADVMRKPNIAERWFRKNSGAMLESLEKDKMAHLEQLADQFRQQGNSKVSTTLMRGASSVEITRAAIKNGCDLVVRYRKGAGSRLGGLFGTTALNLLHICPCPVLLVAPGQQFTQASVLACVDVHDDDRANNSIIKAAETLNRESSPGFHVLYCWELWGHHVLRSRMPEEAFEEVLQMTREENEELYKQFLVKHGLDEAFSRTVIEYGQPYRVIPTYVANHDINVAVMCTVSAGHPTSRVLGSTIEGVINELPCALLAVKPQGFKSPYAE